MTITAIVLLNIALDAAIVAALAYVMRTPFRAFRSSAPVVELRRAAEPTRLAA
jgi:hypothetical protein